MARENYYLARVNADLAGHNQPPLSEAEKRMVLKWCGIGANTATLTREIMDARKETT